MHSRPHIALVGVPGSVGRALSGALVGSFQVRALFQAAESHEEGPGIQVRPLDPFSLLESEKALKGVDVAVYLAHSRVPAARLTQGRPQDLELIAADNFARAARRAGVRRIVYLGSLLPEGPATSERLRSRRELEEAVASSGVPVTVLRVGLVVGAGSPSFEILFRLVRRLPVVPCPGWTSHRTQPIALADVLRMITACLEHPEAAGVAVDLGGPEIVTYLELLERTARSMSLRRRFLDLPGGRSRPSALWLHLVSQAPAELVRWLVEGLAHDLLPRDRQLQQALIGEGTPLDTAIDAAVRPQAATVNLLDWNGRAPAASTVCSVQRLPRPEAWTAGNVAVEFFRWLPAALRPFLRVTVTPQGICSFFISFLPWPLLILELQPERSSPDRVLLFVTGGLLVRYHPKGRLEFREMLRGRFVLTAVFEFQPRLPWFLYVITQAIAHLAVMLAFGRHLRDLPPGTPPPQLRDSNWQVDQGRGAVSGEEA